MQIIELSESDHDLRLDTPFNPPPENDPEEDFLREFDAIYSKVALILSDFGDNDSYGQGAYCLEPGIVRSRGLGCEINKPDFVTEPLLSRLQHLLKADAPDWEIYLRSGNFDYGIFIGPTAIRLYRKTPQLLPMIRTSQSGH